MEKRKEILKSVFGVVAIYIIAVLLSLIMCDRVNDLESNKDNNIKNNNIVMNLK